MPQHSPDIASQLHELARAIRQASQDSDSKLLLVGNQLTSAVAALGTLTQRFESLPRELETKALRETNARLDEVSRQIPTIGASLLDEKATLSQLVEGNQQVGARIAQIKKTIGVISILAMNAQIETAHIKVSGEDFAAFAKEIVRLAKKAEATIDGYAAEHGKLAALLGQVCETQARFLRTQDETLSTAGRRLAESLQTMEARRLRAAGVAVEIGQRTKSIADDVGAIVMALQIGDITRQRLEHVAETLEAFVAADESDPASETTPASWSAGLSKGQRNALLAVVSRMESAQLDHAAKEFDTKIRSLVASLQRLITEASDIVRIGGETYGSAGGDGRSFLEDLDGNLRRAGELMSECEATRRSVDCAIATLAASLDKLLARIASVHGIEAEMRLVGLNTALRCGRLGIEGRTLSVISQELRGYANQTVEDANRLSSSLRDITEVAEQFKQSGRRWNGEQLAEIKTHLAAASQPFQECGFRMGQALSALNVDGGTVSRTLAEAADGMSWHAAITGTLQSAQADLTNMISSLPCEPLDEQELTRRLAFFSEGRYTMASERGIHDQFAVGGSYDDPAPSANADAALADILF